MIKLLNVYKDKSYLYEYRDNDTVVKLEKYNPNNPNIRLHFEDDDYNMELGADDIHIDICGNIYFELNDIKYIIDDGYRFVMVRAGYIVREQYDNKKRRIEDKEVGKMIKESIIKDLHILDEFGEVTDVNDETFYQNFLDDFIYKISYTSVDNLVNINKTRKINKQPFYPFDKTMDKYGTYFICIYAERINGYTDEQSKYDKADSYISDIIKHLNKQHDTYKYHYRPVYIKKRIINNGINNI